MKKHVDSLIDPSQVERYEADNAQKLLLAVIGFGLFITVAVHYLDNFVEYWTMTNLS